MASNVGLLLLLLLLLLLAIYFLLGLCAFAQGVHCPKSPRKVNY